MKHLTAIILAAGKGTRMKSKDKNKVAIEVQGEPMLLRTVRILNDARVAHIVVVVGFAKNSVTSLLKNGIIVAEQAKRLGTGHAVKVALPKIPDNTEDVLILYGDDTFMYSPLTFKELYERHNKSDAKITFITMDSQNPTGYGRIMRDGKQNVVGIVEEKNATEKQKKIKEINLGCYLIDKKYLEKNIRHIQKNELTSEYYITDIIDIIAKQKGKIEAYKLVNCKWKGINTKEDLLEAENLLSTVL